MSHCFKVSPGFDVFLLPDVLESHQGANTDSSGPRDSNPEGPSAENDTGPSQWLSELSDAAAGAE